VKKKDTAVPTSCTSPGATPALSRQAFIAVLASCGAVSDASCERNEPIGVLHALTITASCDERVFGRGVHTVVIVGYLRVDGLLASGDTDKEGVGQGFDGGKPHASLNPQAFSGDDITWEK